jgi:hypothetical protein
VNTTLKVVTTIRSMLTTKMAPALLQTHTKEHMTMVYYRELTGTQVTTVVEKLVRWKFLVKKLHNVELICSKKAGNFPAFFMGKEIYLPP